LRFFDSPYAGRLRWTCPCSKGPMVSAESSGVRSFGVLGSMKVRGRAPKCFGVKDRRATEGRNHKVAVENRSYRGDRYGQGINSAKRSLRLCGVIGVGCEARFLEVADFFCEIDKRFETTEIPRQARDDNLWRGGYNTISVIDNHAGFGRAIVVGSACHGSLDDGRWARAKRRQVAALQKGGNRHDDRIRQTVRRTGPARPTNGIDRADDRRSQTTDTVGLDRGAAGRQKNKNCKTNPSLIKPAWKTVKRKAKNEPKLERVQTAFQGTGKVKMSRVCPCDAWLWTAVESALTGGAGLVRWLRRFPR
jgi:hypothetical protein